MGKTELEVSEVGFPLWPVASGAWGSFSDEQAMDLLRKAYDAGINYFDVAPTDGNGRGESLLGKTFQDRRELVIISSKVGRAEGRPDFSPGAIKASLDKTLDRLASSYVDVLQLHYPDAATVGNAAVWQALEDVKAQGKIRYYGIALGPAIGWLYEGVNCIRERDLTSVQHIYNMLEQHPGRAFHDAAAEASKDTMFLIRVTHSSGMLEGKYTAETKFPPTDHRSHRPRTWLLNGIKKVEQLRFLENPERTLGQAALQWLLADDRVASTLPNIYNEEQLVEFAKAPDTVSLTNDEMAKIEELHFGNFRVEEEPPKFKGTMELPQETVAV